MMGLYFHTDHAIQVFNKVRFLVLVNAPIMCIPYFNCIPWPLLQIVKGQTGNRDGGNLGQFCWCKKSFLEISKLCSLFRVKFQHFSFFSRQMDGWIIWE